MALVFYFSSANWCHCDVVFPFSLLDFAFVLCVLLFCLHVCLCTVCMADAVKAIKGYGIPQRSEGDIRSLGQELLIVVSHLWALGTKPRSSGK